METPILGHKRTLWDTSRQLIETDAGHAAELVFDGFLKHAEALKSIIILPMEVSVPKHIIVLMGTLFAIRQSHKVNRNSDR